MQIKKSQKKEFTVIVISGDMDAYDAEELEKEVFGVISAGDKNILMDFGGLEYISSSGLRALINIRGRIQKEGGKMILACLKDKVLEVFRISKLLSIFDVRPSLDDAG